MAKEEPKPKTINSILVEKGWIPTSISPVHETLGDTLLQMSSDLLRTQFPGENPADLVIIPANEAIRGSGYQFTADEQFLIYRRQKYGTIGDNDVFRNVGIMWVDHLVYNECNGDIKIPDFSKL